MEDADVATTRAFKAWLRDARERAGLTQAELADMLDVDRRNVVAYEGKGGLPRGLALVRYLLALGVKIDPPPPVPAGTSALDEANRKLDEVLAALKPAAMNNLAGAGARPEMIRLIEQFQENYREGQTLVSQILEMASLPDSARFRRAPASGRAAGADDPSRMKAQAEQL